MNAISGLQLKSNQPGYVRKPLINAQRSTSPDESPAVTAILGGNSSHKEIADAAQRLVLEQLRKNGADDGQKVIVSVEQKKLPNNKIITLLQVRTKKLENRAEKLGQISGEEQVNEAQACIDEAQDINAEIAQIREEDLTSEQYAQVVKLRKDLKDAVAKLLEEINKLGIANFVNTLGLNAIASNNAQTSEAQEEGWDASDCSLLPEANKLLLSLLLSLYKNISDGKKAIEKAFEEADDYRAELEKLTAQKQAKRKEEQKFIEKKLEKRLELEQKALAQIKKRVDAAVSVLSSPNATKAQIIAAIEDLHKIAGKLQVISDSLAKIASKQNGIDPAGTMQLTTSIQRIQLSVNKLIDSVNSAKSAIEAAV